MTDPDPILPDEVLRQRIRRLMETVEHRAPSGLDSILRHPFTMLIVGFVLTGVIGAIIAGRVQSRADEAKREAEVREARRAAALRTIDTAGVLLNRTFFLFGEYWDAIKRDAPATDLTARFARFDSARSVFESRRWIDAARVQVHFGRDLRLQYEKIADSLQHLAGGFDIARHDRSAIRGLAPSVDQLKALMSRLFIDMVTAADSISLRP